VGAGECEGESVSERQCESGTARERACKEVAVGNCGGEYARFFFFFRVWSQDDGGVGDCESDCDCDQGRERVTRRCGGCG